MDDLQHEGGHLLDYWRVLMGRKEIMIAVSLFVILTGVVVTIMMPRTYMAATRIAVRDNNPDVPPFQMVKSQQNMSMGWNYDPYFLRTQFEIIQSRPILYDVIGNLKLQEHFGRMYADDGSPYTPQEAADELEQSMKVQQYRDTNLIELRVYRSTRHSSPEIARQDAARIVNEIAAVYRDHRMKSLRDESERGLAALEGAFRAEQKRVVDTELKLEKLRKDLRISSFDAMGTGRNTAASLDTIRVQQLEGARIQARNNMLDRKTRLDELQRLHGSELLYAAALIVRDPMLSSIRDAVVEAETMYRRLKETLGARHPDVIRQEQVVEGLHQKMDETVKGIVTGLQTEYAIAESQLAASEKDLKAAQVTEISAQSDRYMPFVKLQAELERQRELRDTLEKRLLQERIELDLPRTPVEVVATAEVPEINHPVSPRVPLNIVLSVVFGLFCGIGVVFFIEYMDTSVKELEEFEQYIKAPIFGVVPQKVQPLPDEKTETGHGEAYRVLRMNIQFSKRFAGGKTLCMTSGGAGEGKSLTTFNLAFVCGQLGQKVLLVDADLRRPSQHKLFKADARPGFSDLLQGTVTVEAATRRSPRAPGVDFILSGRPLSATQGLLNSQRIRTLIDELKPKYDLIIFDSAPIIGVSDASIVCSVVDGVILIVKHRGYPRAMAARAKAMIENLGTPCLGVVLNNLNASRDYSSYYNSSRYGYYQAPSSKGRDEEPPAAAGQARASQKTADVERTAQA